MTDLTNRAISIFFFSSAGYLLKKSAKTNGWSKRWFVLNEKSGKVNQFSWIFFFELLICLWYLKLWGCPSVFQIFLSACCWSLYFMVLIWSTWCDCIHHVFFLYQLGYTKKQEERHFRGVITLEVCIIFAFIFCVIYSATLKWYMIT